MILTIKTVVFCSNKFVKINEVEDFAKTRRRLRL